MNQEQLFNTLTKHQGIGILAMYMKGKKGKGFLDTRFLGIEANYLGNYTLDLYMYDTGFSQYLRVSGQTQVFGETVNLYEEDTQKQLLNLSGIGAHIDYKRCIDSVTGQFVAPAFIKNHQYNYYLLRSRDHIRLRDMTPEEVVIMHTHRNEWDVKTDFSTCKLLGI